MAEPASDSNTLPAAGSIWLVNQFVPPDLAPTARLLEELSEGLTRAGWSVRFLSGNSGYRGGPVGGLRRWLRDLAAHGRLMLRGLSGTRPDIILCLTDPPALVFTVGCLGALRRARIVHWSMDVYPEIAVALGALGKDSVICKTLAVLTHWALRRCGMVVSLDEDMRRLLSSAPASEVIPPWPPKNLVIPGQILPISSPVIRWLYSGNLGRAHDFETLLQAQKILEESSAPFELVFQGGGASREPALQLAKDLGLHSCTWTGYADDRQLIPSLLGAHVLVATQRDATRGLLWPSKLALLQALPRPIVWVGAPQGAIAASLRLHPGTTGIFASGDAQGLAQWLLVHAEDFRKAALQPVAPQVITDHLDSQREKSLNRWHHILSRMLSSPTAVLEHGQ